MKRQNDKDNRSIKDYEAKAEELVAMTLGVCERRLAEPEKTPPPHGEALASAAMCVRDSVKTFIAVSRISEEE